MAVILFCGGLGMRIREETRHVPKPMVRIGEPVLLRLMRYDAYHGHRRFVLCLGYQSDAIIEYFLRYPDLVTIEEPPKQILQVKLGSDLPCVVTLVPTGEGPGRFSL
jgi:NDP-sugar pyrophosphorylase family protein